MWEKAKPIFKDVIAELKPKCIIFVCKSVYDHVVLDSRFPASDSLVVDGSYPPTLKIYKNNHPTAQIDDALASWIYHPSCHCGGFRRPRGVVSPLITAAGGKVWV